MRLANPSSHQPQRIRYAAVITALAITFIFGNVISLARRKKKVTLDPMLLGIEIVVPAVHGIKLLVRAAFHDLSLLHDQNLIGPPDGREPMCNHKRGASLH